MMVTNENCETMTYHVGEKFQPCPFCGFSDDLTIKRTSKYIPSIQCLEYSYSIRCDYCDMTYGESSDGTQIYDTESELLANWNRRKY